jgi:hypothetical protein
VRLQLEGGGSNYYNDEEERGEDKCEGNHRVKENNTNINMAVLLPQEETVPLRRSVDKVGF